MAARSLPVGESSLTISGEAVCAMMSVPVM
jgi:hypothetical protein